MRRYKEIIFGFGLGLAMWMVDAAMHVQLAADTHPPGSFAVELLNPGATQLIFRSLFLFIATLLGWTLWRANWRERELRALENAIIAFHRQLDSPAMRIVSRIRMLKGRPGVMRDGVAASVVEAIGEDARAIDDLAQQYIKFSELVMAGRNVEAITTLQAIGAWTSNARASVAAAQDLPPSTS